ncbi:MAG: S49 family peptidase [Chloroflexota bacterium]
MSTSRRVYSPAPSPLLGPARFVLWVILPLLVGIILAMALVPVPQVGVIRFQDVIWSESAAGLSVLLDRARDDPNIRGVVLEIDSPGGEVTATEELYYRLLELRQTKPLVVSIDSMAASGGYYMAAAADHIFAKPASTVGNVGVISFLPSVDEQRFTDEDYVSTGPFKFSGGSRGDYMRQIELIKLGFLEAVFAQRGARLQIDRQTLSSGEVFLGLQAQRLGLVDDLGANSEAVQKAARLAQLAHYQVVDVAALVFGEQPPLEESSYGSLEEVLAQSDPAWKQGFYYLYIEPEKRR